MKRPPPSPDVCMLCQGPWKKGHNCTAVRREFAGVCECRSATGPDCSFCEGWTKALESAPVTREQEKALDAEPLDLTRKCDQCGVHPWMSWDDWQCPRHFDPGWECMGVLAPIAPPEPPPDELSAEQRTELDRLGALTEAELDAEVRAYGGDPEKIAAEVLELVDELSARERAHVEQIKARMRGGK